MHDETNDVCIAIAISKVLLILFAGILIIYKSICKVEKTK